MEIKFNQLKEELESQYENLKIRLKGDFLSIVLFAHLWLYLLRMTLEILKHFKII